MSTNPHQSPQPPPVAVYREVVGLLLLVVAAALVLVAAYRTDLDLGLALTGVLLGVAGFGLTVRRKGT